MTVVDEMMKDSTGAVVVEGRELNWAEGEEEQGGKHGVQDGIFWVSCLQTCHICGNSPDFPSQGN